MREFITFLLAVSLAFCVGCKSGSNDAHNTINTQNKPFIPTIGLLKGRVVKGVSVNSRVEVFLANGSNISWDLPVGYGYTDLDGRFEIALDERLEGSTLLLRAVLEAGITKHVCDLLDGCAEAEFGDSALLEESFSLHLGIPQLNFDRSYFISTLSDISFAIAERKRIEPVFQQRLLNANAELTNLFGVASPLESVEIVDITQQAEILSADVSSLKASILNSALVSASQAEFSLHSDSGIEFFKEQIIGFGVPGNSNLDVVVSRLDVFDEMFRLLVHTGLDKSDPLLAGQIKAAQYLAFVDQQNRFESASPELRLVAPPIEQAKNFVETLRQIAASIELSKLSSISNFDSLLDGGIGDLFEGFGVEFDDLSLVTSEDSKALFSGLLKVFLAVLKSQISDFSTSTIPTEVDGIMLNPTKENGKYTFRINSNVDVCNTEPGCSVFVDLTIESEFDTPSSLGGGQEGLRALGAKYSLRGRLENSGARIQFNEKDQVFNLTTVTLKLPGDGSAMGDINSLDITLESAEFKIPFLEVFKGDEDQGEVSGVIDAVIEDLDMAYSFEETTSSQDGVVSKVNRTSFPLKNLGYLNFNVAGAAASAEEESFLGAVNVSTSRPIRSDSIEFVMKTLENCENTVSAECSEGKTSFGLEGETEQDFADFNATVLFKANLKGVVDPLIMQMSGVRTSLNTSEIVEMRLAQPEQSIVLSGEFTNTGANRLDAVNQDGMTMKIDMPEGGGDRFGGVWSADGELLATMKDFRTWLKITYIDGSFVSM